MGRREERGRGVGGSWRWAVLLLRPLCAGGRRRETRREERLVLGLDVVRGRAGGGARVLDDAAARLGDGGAAAAVEAPGHKHPVGVRVVVEMVEARVARLRGGCAGACGGGEGRARERREQLVSIERKKASTSFPHPTPPRLDSLGGLRIALAEVGDHGVHRALNRIEIKAPDPAALLRGEAGVAVAEPLDELLDGLVAPHPDGESGRGRARWGRARGRARS